MRTSMGTGYGNSQSLAGQQLENIEDSYKRIKDLLSKHSKKIRISVQNEQAKKEDEFVKEIAEYVQDRQKDPRSHNLYTTIARYKFIEKVLTARIYDDTDSLQKLLSEESIKKFKGFHATKLYDICKKYQENVSIKSLWSETSDSKKYNTATVMQLYNLSSLKEMNKIYSL